MREKEPSIPIEPFQAKESHSHIAELTSNKIRELENSDDKLVREERFINNSVEDSISYYGGMKKLFEDIRNNNGVNIPDIDVVIGSNTKGEKRVFMIVDKIEGQPLNELKNVPKEEEGKFERFYVGALQSMVDAYKDRKPYIADLKPENIMYGYKAKEDASKKDFFLHDIGYDSFWYPKGDKFSKETAGSYMTKRSYDGYFIRCILHFKESINSFEQIFDEPAKLTLIKEKISEIYEYLKIDNKTEIERLEE